MMQLDKITHIFAGAAIAAALLPWGVIPALLAVVVAAVGKEVWDAQGHGTPDRIDALVTVIGGVLMLGWLLYAAPFFVSIQTGVFR
ncbi:MAG TPA: hypothetical protein PKV17_05695 [Aquabacterium sp.]|nr:hypothetical protein [Aquabacterium sp.]